MNALAKPKYRTTNWKGDDAALKARSLLLIWLDRDMCWHGSASDKSGRRQKHREAAIQFCLTIEGPFNLALRQAMGMAQSLLKLAGLDWEVPNFSTVSRRQKHLAVMTLANKTTSGLHLLVDSTAAKMLGEGEWKAKKRGAQAINPTRKNGKTWKDRRPGAEARNAILHVMRHRGHRIWKKWTSYHRRSLVETKMRWLKLLGERVMARDFDRQAAELQVRAIPLNRFTRLGTPMTVAMA